MTAVAADLESRADLTGNPVKARAVGLHGHRAAR
jgi:hypothetical protein